MSIGRTTVACKVAWRLACRWPRVPVLPSLGLGVLAGTVRLGADADPRYRLPEPAFGRLLKPCGSGGRGARLFAARGRASCIRASFLPAPSRASSCPLRLASGRLLPPERAVCCLPPPASPSGLSLRPSARRLHPVLEGPLTPLLSEAPPAHPLPRPSQGQTMSPSSEFPQHAPPLPRPPRASPTGFPRWHQASVPRARRWPPPALSSPRAATPSAPFRLAPCPPPQPSHPFLRAEVGSGRFG